MSTPGGYATWCEARGLNPWHPTDWDPAAHAAYRAWSLARFRARWRWRVAIGQVDIIRAQSGRAFLLRDVRTELAEALRPLARSPYRQCPCHRQRFVTSAITPKPEDYIDDEDLAVWRAGDRMSRQTMSARKAVALAYIDTFKPMPRKEAAA